VDSPVDCVDLVALDVEDFLAFGFVAAAGWDWFGITAGSLRFELT
jgi:hypothetical protein